MPREKLVAVSEVAGRMGVEKTVARKWLKKQGYEFVTARDPVSRQRVNALSARIEGAGDYRPEKRTRVSGPS